MSQYPDQTAAIDVSAIWTTRYVGFSAFAILIWDHVITFPDEVKYMWTGKKTLLIYLFFFIRYAMPLSFIVNLVAYTLRSWDQDSCERYVRYEGVMTAVGIEVVGLMMLIRVYALYHKSRLIAGGVAFMLFVETGINVYLLVYASAVAHWSPSRQGPSYAIHSCSMIFGGSRIATSASAWMPLLYETIVFKLTLFRTLESLKNGDSGYLLRIMFRDGLIYYAVIFTVNLTLTVMLISAPVGIQNVAAQFQLILTIIMMSRITLNLRRRAHGPIGASEDTYDYEDYDDDDDEGRVKRRSFSVRSQGKRRNTQSWSPSALGTIHSEPVSRIQTREGEDVQLSSDPETFELRRIGPMAGRQT